MDDHDKYVAWQARFYESVRATVPEHAGRTLDGRGDFENVGFHMGAAYGREGDAGGVIIALSLKPCDSFGQQLQKQLTANWRNDGPESVAKQAIDMYIRLRIQNL